MLVQEVYTHVLPAVKLLLQDLNGAATSENADALVHGKLWPYVTHAVRELNPSAVPTAKRDGRSKSWQYVVRFWEMTAIGPQQLAVTDVEMMQGTGSLVGIVQGYVMELHEIDTLPSELSEESIKAKLPQLRNNLGRQDSAVLRLEYKLGDDSYLCQVDVAKPGA